MRKVKNKDFEAIEQQLETLNSNIQRIADFEDELQEFVNQKLAEFRVDGMTLEEFSEKHNAKLEDTQRMVEDITCSIDDYMSDRSDKWLESDNGVATQEWLEQWQEFEGSFDQMVSFDIAEVNIDVPTLEEFELPPQEREQ